MKRSTDNRRSPAENGKMKYIEKLKEDHPECVSDEFAGGCEGCPEDYGYESRDEYCPDGLEGLGIEVACRKCWEREMPEEKSRAG